MKVLTFPQLMPPHDCSYITGKSAREEVFYALEIDPLEMDLLLENGWRKFGLQNFKPACGECKKCVPLRVVCTLFKENKNQRRIIQKNHDTKVSFYSNFYDPQLFELYKKHSRQRFQKETIESEEDFKESFFTNTGTHLISIFWAKNNNGEEKIIAFGILEKSTNALSSVYFVYDPDYSALSLGTFGALKEIAYAKEHQLSYYYLGYWIAENKSMAYKNSFKENEIFDWDNNKWKLNNE